MRFPKWSLRPAAVQVARFNSAVHEGMNVSDEETAKGLERADPRLLELLVCPVTKQLLHYDRERQELVSDRANLAYPIRSGVPLMTREAARSLDEPASGKPSS